MFAGMLPMQLPLTQLCRPFIAFGTFDLRIIEFLEATATIGGRSWPKVGDDHILLDDFRCRR